MMSADGPGDSGSHVGQVLEIGHHRVSDGVPRNEDAPATAGIIIAPMELAIDGSRLPGRGGAR